MLPMQPRLFGGRPPAWNPGDKSAGIAVTGSGRIATASATVSYSSVRSVRSRGSGRWHFEATFNSVNSAQMGVGIANAGASLAAFIGANLNGVALFRDGSVYSNGSGSGVGIVAGAGETVAVEVDFVGGNIYFQKVGGARTAGYPLSGLNAGPYFAALTVAVTGEQVTLNTGPTSTFKIRPTAGFQAWR